VTTQHTQQEHDDVDATVVQHTPTPGASVDSIASETTAPTEAEEQVSTSSTEPVASILEVTSEASDEIAAPNPSSVEEPVQSAETAPVEEREGNQEEEQQPPLAEALVEKERPMPEAPVTEAVHVEFPYQDVLSLTKESENEVRPFTAFIEEFRLAEEQARRQVSLPETSVEVANSLPSANDLSAPSEEEASTQETPAPAEEEVAVVEEQSTPVASASAAWSEVRAEAMEALTKVLEEPNAESSEEPKAEVPVESKEVEAKAEVPVEPVAEVKTGAETPVTSIAGTGEPQQLAAPAEPEKVEAKNSETPAAESSVPTPPAPERAVSPLLRPATPRVRSPRHARHLREEPVVAAPTEKPLQPAEGQTPAATKAGQPATTEPTATPLVEQVGQQTAPAEPPAPPRPARRYRFDRPAASNNGTAPTLPSRSEENKETLSRSSSTAASEQTAEPTIKAASKSVQAEQPASKPQESPTQETQSVAAPETTSRRRGHDRQKETVAATPATPPVVEPVNPVVEPAPMQLEEIAPEDLPPLEYAELQKTSTTRRRRRHRSSTGNGNGTTVAAAPAETPVAPTPATSPLGGVPVVPSTPPPAPLEPAANATANGAYSIVSGYTVSQMNQGNDTTGPFMGPDPSPARGSVMSRDGRTVNRAEAQRSPTPLYPSRSHAHEGGLTTAAFNQLTNSLVQALQNQTDRMVSELRRTNAAPTNVSVSLPPFPSTERVGVFVDVANLLYSARTLRISVDFGKLLDFLRGNRRLVRAHAYCPTSPQAGDEQMFLQAVKGLGYRITTKNYKTFSSGAKKADLDLDLCMDVVRLVDGSAVDCVVLVSGDSDFMPMLDYCSDHGVRVEVAAFDEAMSATLRQSCDLFVNLSMLEEIRS
jgi:uncharacterized LabA/DUF88 family protein